MKPTTIALFCFTFVVAAKAQDFLKPESPFLKKLNSTQDCKLKDCGAFVAKDDCGSICNKNQAEQFGNLMNRVYARVEKPVCDVTLGNMLVGDVETPLKINNIECSLKGPLTVQMTRNDAKAQTYNRYEVAYPSYLQKADWTVVFRGLTVQCPTGSDVEGRVDVTVDISNYQSFWLAPSDPNAQVEYQFSVNEVAFVQYPAGDPKGISKNDLATAVEKTFKEAEIMIPLHYYFRALSNVLLINCIAPNCPTCPPVTP